MSYSPPDPPSCKRVPQQNILPRGGLSSNFKFKYSNLQLLNPVTGNVLGTVSNISSLSVV